MQIDAVQRSVHLSVREFALFRNLPKSESRTHSPWRATVGQQWHKTSEEELRQLNPEAQFEVSIKADIQHRDWTFKLQGRVDQILPVGEALCIREVKTVRKPLPAALDELLDQHPDYFAQAASYLAMAKLLPEYSEEALTAELLFIDIETGAAQIVPLEEELQERFDDQLNTWIPFLEDRRLSRLRLTGARIRPAFGQLREGQSELFKTLNESSLKAKTVLLEAPTGFGKTGIILEHALQQLKAGVYERCIYLTSKATGQIETIRQLQSMVGDQVRYIQMRNRKEHMIVSEAHTCTGDRRCEDGLVQRWFEAGIYPPKLLAKGTLTLDEAKVVGAQTGICPYSLTKVCLPYAEFWVGDSNYVFSPSSQGVFLDQHGFEAKKTLLIVDEAHNLPSRTADSLSVELQSGDLLFALEELRSAGANRRLLAVGDEIIRFIEELRIEEKLNANESYELLDLCEDFSKQLAELQIDYGRCAPFALELVWRIPDLVHRLNQPSNEWFHWSPSLGRVCATCLDAGKWINQCIQSFGGSIMMSATISPVENFQTQCGLNQGQTTVAIGHAPWRESAYEVAVDCRVDTRFKKRERYYECTAKTVCSLISANPGEPVAVFFASYQYAENIRTYLEAIDPSARILLQPRGVDLVEQEDFIDRGLLTADALFLILGSSYAEGVDKLGGNVSIVMVVGPALPEVNPVQQARMDAHTALTRDEQFRDVYILPAMQRIHQALGRTVRAPEHKARVLLHCKRYAELAYRSALAEEYQTAHEIYHDSDLLKWLEQTQYESGD